MPEEDADNTDKADVTAAVQPRPKPAREAIVDGRGWANCSVSSRWAFLGLVNCGVLDLDIKIYLLPLQPP